MNLTLNESIRIINTKATCSLELVKIPPQKTLIHASNYQIHQHFILLIKRLYLF